MTKRLLLMLLALLSMGQGTLLQADDTRMTRLDFKRNSRTEAQLTLGFSGTLPPSPEVIQNPGSLILQIARCQRDAALDQRLDLRDFSTAVQTVRVKQDREDAIVEVNLAPEPYDYTLNPAEGQWVVLIRSREKATPPADNKTPRPGGRISFNFQDIPVRSILQLMADFATVNIIASDSVTGNMTLKLDDIPWEEALDLILKARSLGSIKENNIIWVAPREDIRKAQTEELEARQAVEELEPLKTEIIPVNYTTAEELKKVLIGITKRTNTTVGQGTGIGGSSLNQTVSTLDQSESILSARGNVTADNRTNQLIVKDTAFNLERIRELVHQLDKPVRQVLIESRIVIASHDFSRELGSRLSVSPASRLNNDGQPTDTGQVESSRSNRFDMLVDLASTAAASSGGAFGLTLLKAGDYLLDLELSAAQMEGRGEIISNPRLITADHTKASIKQGVEIPYQVMTASGGGSVSNIQFKEAVLQLDVTPSIAPDNNVLLQLNIKKDAKGQDTSAGPTIDKREIETTARVGNGETVVLGGVFEGTRGQATQKVPWLGDIPGLGFLFRRNTVSDTRRELLIFITPRIVNGSP